MKKTMMSVFMILFIGHITVFSQYQIRNGNFESWDSLSTPKEEPTHWNSFKTGSGSLIILSAKQLMQSSNTHSEGGNYCVKIWARVVFGITANGTITTGQVNMGSTTASNTANHNATRIADDNFNAPLIAKPDSISFWAKFDCPSESQQARMNAVIHTNHEYQDPGGDTNHVVATATLNFTRCEWTKFTVPFVDVQDSVPAFILITFTTNAIPGEGSKKDTLSIDDVELIYERRLSSLELDSVGIKDFDEDVTEYTIGLPSCVNFPTVTCSTLSNRAKYTITQATADNPVATIEVINGDPALNKIYIVHFHKSDIDKIHHVVNVSRCGAGIVELTVTHDSNMACCWYDSEFSTTIISSSNSFITPFLSTTTTYYVAHVDSNDCRSEKVAITAIINPEYRDTIRASIHKGEMYTENGFNESVSGNYVQNLKTIAGCDSIVVLVLTDNNTGIASVSIGNEVDLYPNPSLNHVWINSHYPIVTVELYDIIGKMVKREINIGNTQTKLELDNIVSGLYSVKITTEKGVIVKRLIIQ
jgi:hypothetical protein